MIEVEKSDVAARKAGAATRTLLLHPVISASDDADSREEFLRLAESAGLEIVAQLRAPREHPDPKFLVGSGKVDEIAEIVQRENVGLVLVNAKLSPVQERNLVRRLCVNVLDRTTLILDIFAQRARSHEGKLQVELAQLRHLSTRLVRGWTHLERQRGGIGMRGPGETQLETDRRLLAGRIRSLTQRLDKVEQRRAEGRRARDRSQTPLIALVGYTNAGKSTLFNRLTDSGVMAQDQLFATLDPTVRRIDSLPGRPILLSDTVGFIRDLPHELVAAFRATLEETLSATLVVHLIDGASPDRGRHQVVVDTVLEDIGADSIPQLKVFNKVDLTDRAPGLERNENGQVKSVWVSAQTGIGMDALKRALVERVGEGRIHRWIELGPQTPRLRAALFELGVVRQENVDDDGQCHLEVELDRRDARILTRLDGRDGKLALELLLH